MSWGALPWWLYEIALERQQALASGAFQEEVDAGWTRAVPEHVVMIDRRRWEQEAE